MDGDGEVDNDALQKFLGTSSFGKQDRKGNVEKQVEQSKRAAAQAPPQSAIDDDGPGMKREEADENDRRSQEDEDEDDEDDSEDDDDEDEFPTSHEMTIKTHDRAVTSVTVDPSGTRLISGSMDCTLKLHDFASMTPTTIRAFRSVDPAATKTSASTETHPIHQVIFNPISPRQVLVITAFPQARILNRDGEAWVEFQKGDMYLRDMHNTKGHISEVTAGAWHPTNPELCVTAGTDSTLRIWDVNNPRSHKEVIVHKSRIAGSAGRSRMTAVAWGKGQDGTSILLGAALDGTLLMWLGEGPFSRPTGEIRDAHTKDTWTSSIAISTDGRMAVTRGGDDTIKLWDLRNFKKPVNTVAHPSTSSQYPSSNICYSPSSANIIVGSETGHLHILNPATLRPELVTPVTSGSALITVQWHAKLNQIITGSANGETHVLYSPDLSTSGAKLVMSKAPKRRHIDDDPSLTTDTTLGMSGDSIIVPGGPLPSTVSQASRHPTVGLTASGRSRDPRRPHVPQTTPFAKSNPDSAYVKEYVPFSSMRDEDPREALLKYADKAKNDPLFTQAWSQTQPKTQFADLSDEEGEDEPDKKKARR